MKHLLASICLALAVPASAQAQVEPQPELEADALTLAETRASLVGLWRGEIQYQDFESEEWISEPFTIEYELMGDGVTLIRKMKVENPIEGTVHMTTVSVFDPDTQQDTLVAFRKGSPVETVEFTLELTTEAVGGKRDRRHWKTLVESVSEQDGRPVRIRETAIRNGNSFTTRAEADFSDDDVEEWVERDRMKLRRVQ